MPHPKWIVFAAVIPAVYLAGAFIALDLNWVTQVEAFQRAFALFLSGAGMFGAATFPEQK